MPARSVAGLAHVQRHATIHALDEGIEGGAAGLAPVEQFDHVDAAPSGFTKAHVASLDAHFLCEIALAQSCMKPELRQLYNKGDIGRRCLLVHVTRRCLSRVPSRRF